MRMKGRTTLGDFCGDLQPRGQAAGKEAVEKQQLLLRRAELELEAQQGLVELSAELVEKEVELVESEVEVVGCVWIRDLRWIK